MPFPRSQAIASAVGKDAARTVGDAVVMLRGLSGDPRVPQAAKLEMSAAVAYLVTGRGRIPAFIPLVGRIDAVAIAAFSLRRLLQAVDEPVLRSHWRGSQRSLDALLATTSALAAPGGKLRRVAAAGAAASYLRGRVSGESRAPASGRTVKGSGKVISGEVISRREERR